MTLKVCLGITDRTRGLAYRAWDGGFSRLGWSHSCFCVQLQVSWSKADSSGVSLSYASLMLFLGLVYGHSLSLLPNFLSICPVLDSLFLTYHHYHPLPSLHLHCSGEDGDYIFQIFLSCIVHVCFPMRGTHERFRRLKRRNHYSLKIITVRYTGRYEIHRSFPLSS